MKRDRSGLIAGVILALALTDGCSRTASPPAAPQPAASAAASDSPRVILPDGFAVQVEVASDDATREQGLMYRDQLAENRGMIFLFRAAGLYPFWMKNTLIPLDMIWIDRDHRVVFVSSDVRPCKADPCASYGPGNRESLYVLETTAGVARRHGVVEGAAMRFEGLDRLAVH